MHREPVDPHGPGLRTGVFRARGVEGELRHPESAAADRAAVWVGGHLLKDLDTPPIRSTADPFERATFR